VITVIIETRDDAVRLARTLAALVPAAMDGIVREAVVVDHGSRDETRDVADAAGCIVVEGRGLSEARRDAGAGARGDWLLFLSPSSRLEPGWQTAALAFVDGALIGGHGRSRAATFRLAREGRGLRPRVAEWLAWLRTRMLAAPTREQGLLLPRAFYNDLGGHRPLATLADADLARRVGRRRLTLLPAHALIREDDGPRKGAGAVIRNAVCLALMAVHAPGRVIVRLAP
jgi:glycosyltransferase involved in cell wall biosynthesis